MLCLSIASCVSYPPVQPGLLADASLYMQDGVKAFAEADRLRAQALFTRALSIYQGIDDQEGALNSQINLAEVALSARNYHAARLYLQRARAVAETAGLQHYQARIALLSAQSAVQQKQYIQAEKILQSLLPAFDGDMPVKISGDIQVPAIANRTLIAFALKHKAALWTRRYANALKFPGIAAPLLAARLLRFNAVLAAEQGRFETAEVLLQQALAKYKAQLSRPGIAATLVELGQIAMQQGHWREAQAYLQRAILVFRFMDDPGSVLFITESLIKVEKALGNTARSEILSQWLAQKKLEQAKRMLSSQNFSPETGLAKDVPLP